MALMKRCTLGRRAALAGAILIATFALAACGGNDSGARTVPAKSHAGTSGTPAAAFNNVDVMFVRMMIPHHQQAVEMATLAQTRAADPQVKQLAARIKTPQTAEIATMKTWLTTWGQPTTMPSAMPSMPGGGMMPSGMPSGMMPSGPMPSGMPRMPGMMSSADMAKLEVATGKDFDRQFLQMMIAHHKGAIQMAQVELTHGSNSDAKALAGRMIKEQQAEIAAMQKMLARQ
jgi:uncharacterized protein (DUF305 family)